MACITKAAPKRAIAVPPITNARDHTEEILSACTLHCPPRMPVNWRQLLPALPYPHFMAFAPLDTWARLLLGRGRIFRISPRYWLRIAGGLFTSSIGTAITLPERLALAPFFASRFSSIPPRGLRPTTVFVLGYYRSGTTHLHYLLSCDPQFVTPRWYQVLAPQGFALSWTFLRYFLVPFLSSKRPQDDVAYGPEYPSEDDFAHCNWSLCGTMPGRMILPREWDGPDGWARWHSLARLSPSELARFERTQLEFTWKLAALNRGRSILFKTPSHTARVGVLTRLFGPSAKFIHISRTPLPVLKSNIAMHQRFEPFLLQPHPGEEVIRKRVIAEYDQTERAFLDESADVPPDMVATMRYEDLIADPMGQVRRIYQQLGLTLSPEAEKKMVGYLDSVRGYRAASERERKSERPESAAPSREPALALPEQLTWMVDRFGHNSPAVEAPPSTPDARTSASADPAAAGLRAALLTAAICVVLWPALAFIVKNRYDWLIWPVSISIGLAALRAGGRGSYKLGLWAGALVIAVFLARAWPTTFVSEPRWYDPNVGDPLKRDLWHHVWKATRAGAFATKNIWWVGLAAMTAFRFASRQHVRPPGM